MSPWSRYRLARDEAAAGRLREKHPGYHVAFAPGAWNAVHLDSLAVFGPVRTPRKLGRELGDHAWRKTVRTVTGLRIAIRAVPR